MSSSKIPHVLSIQSHVVSGYVGNKSATFPLQLLGFQVDAINSVQLSNHTGYKVFKGQVLDDKDLDNLVAGLSENNLDSYTHLLTGYIGSVPFLKRVASLVKYLKDKNPDLIYVCDPVMGDNGKMYVPEELTEIFKNEIIPLADILTPNYFELELLTGRKTNSVQEILKGIKELHEKGPKIIAISSTKASEQDNKLLGIVSSITEESILKIDIPLIPVSYTGSGDLFAALFLAHMHLEGNVKDAIEKTVNTLRAVLLRTFKYYQSRKETAEQLAQKVELHLIQSKKDIEQPPRDLIAQPL
ncbi:pyridoxal kinase-like [Prorops nasuta]|uniref:pyridoxal kinase-like n=1 Tax=Prorops nasuta TaxID=863751 RepID=UPI0034CF1C53